VQTLGICTALIITETDNDNVGSVVDPEWVGLAVGFLSAISRYSIFASLIGAIATSYGSFRYQTRISSFSPSLMASIGVFAYSVEHALFLYTEYVGTRIDEPTDAQNMRMFLSRSIPLYLFILACPLYVYFLIYETKHSLGAPRPAPEHRRETERLPLMPSAAASGSHGGLR